MRKQLILVRHAKALESDEFEWKDFDRPLSISGEHSVFIMSRYLRLIGIRPTQIIASPAKRTQMTADAIAKRYEISDIEYIAELYNGHREEDEDSNKIHLRALKKAKETTDVLMIVGHNDDLTRFARFLSGDQVPYMKKGSITVLALPEWMGWQDIDEDTLTMVYYLTPQFLYLENLAS